MHVSQHGPDTESWLKRLQKKRFDALLRECAEEGVTALRSATPTDSGATASAWAYEIESTGTGSRIVWTNSNTNGGYSIAVLIEYGHGTGTGGYVAGREYIKSAIRPVFDRIAERIRREVTAP